ncbi:C40 family peptidase [Streptomyces beihaiensis]|uniref:C40 family peptidase n=1 Tax=Streptomyces beihaiensis TaxID=2984495 RepID=A0ABT3U6K1_9ACTN|nr:C40 family peptidase [Streptomyces beihaiensis]MCX3063835.1 C40 family peptidase [Streptomyces beihaiensis]
MSGTVVRWVCTAAVAGALLAPVPARAAAAAPGPDGERSVATLLTDLQKLYRQTEEATEAYDAAREALRSRREETDEMSRKLAEARGALHDSRVAAGRLAREQYQGHSDISPYVRLLLSPDPEHALDQGHVLGQAAKERRAAVDRLVGGERRADDLATKARAALDAQLKLADQEKKRRDTVRGRLRQVEELLASLSGEQLAALTRLEDAGVDSAQRKFMASGALGTAVRAPSRAGNAALDFAVKQIGKPYEWGAEGPEAYDCSGLTARAWRHAGRAIPRTSQEQWARLPRVRLSELRPGDLVVYFPDATHVAMYLGDGMVVQAPRPGARVKVSPIATYPVRGAVRPDPEAGAMPGYRAPWPEPS